MTDGSYTGRCYCGAVTLSSETAPLTVATCHCADCRRLSGAPVNTFAAFQIGAVEYSPPLGAGISHSAGVKRWFCAACGTPLAAYYDYLPDQLYVPVGLFDQVDQFSPRSQSHTGSRVAWVEIDPNLPQDAGSGRELLKAADGEGKD